MFCCCAGPDEQSQAVQKVEDVPAIQPLNPEPKKEPDEEKQPDPPPRVSDATKYDMLIPVEWGLDKTRMYLRLNKGEAPETIADRFIAENNLPTDKAGDVITLLKRMAAPKDFVREIEVADGRKLKIQWSKGDDPESIAIAHAEVWGRIHKDELPKIIKFIEDASAGKEAPPPPTQEQVHKTKSELEELMKQMGDLTGS
mmetsp:Transcript_36505/g.56601  ORF Transcript_36505/g.56601 Transcript_36505/m.56601 type:complete len:199 (+) Transcript_36505:1-597(+)